MAVTAAVSPSTLPPRRRSGPGRPISLLNSGDLTVILQIPSVNFCHDHVRNCPAGSVISQKKLHAQTSRTTDSARRRSRTHGTFEPRAVAIGCYPFQRNSQTGFALITESDQPSRALRSSRTLIHTAAMVTDGGRSQRDAAQCSRR